MTNGRVPSTVPQIFAIFEMILNNRADPNNNNAHTFYFIFDKNVKCLFFNIYNFFLVNSGVLFQLDYKFKNNSLFFINFFKFNVIAQSFTIADYKQY